MTDAYAPVREAAKERQHKGNDLKRNIVEQIPQSEYEPKKGVEQIPQVFRKAAEPKTRDIRAKAAGTNSKYIDLADKIVETRPDLAAEVEAGRKTLSQVNREIRNAELVEKTPPPPTGKYRVICAAHAGCRAS